MRTPTFVIAMLFIIHLSFGQSIRKQAYLVKNNGDTAYGWVNYKNWGKNPSNVTFYADSTSGDGIKYTTKDLQYLEIPGQDRYIKAIVNKDDRPVKVADLLPASVTMTVTDTVLLRVLVKGTSFDLYELLDKKYHLFVKKPGGEPEELRYVLLRNTNGDLVTQSIYIQQLKAYANNTDGDMLKRINAAGYSERDIKPIIVELNAAAGPPEYIADYNSKKIVLSFFAGIGAGYGTVHLSGTHPQLGRMHFKGGLVPVVTIGGDLSTPRNLQDFTMRAELVVSHTTYEGEGRQSSLSSPDVNIINYAVNQTNLSPSVSALYNFIRNQSMKIYAGIGASYNVSFYDKNRYTKTNTNTGDKEETNNFLDLPKSWLCLNAKLGVKLNQWEAGLNGVIYGSFTRYSLFALRPNVYTLMVSYHFNSSYQR